ncbi:D-serine dehydratase isoform X4 [Carcharodon carcharias]|uniref:D-serine dehydratase isoform X4 n=1 Tax=Carcharodon carcharias TaxID=13397 RepID=UPI001B7E66E9|nr:D-serine dehydratase isoform X4 [Carcharodon carcharias]
MVSVASVQQLLTPAFTVDIQKVENNARRMIERCQALGVQLRPHMKTHKTLECADIMTGGSRRCIVVSTLAEAHFYADRGFDDILYAYPLPFDKVDVCAELVECLEMFHVLIDSEAALAELTKRQLKDGKSWLVWLKVDCSNGRVGVRPEDPAALILAKSIADCKGVELAGVYAHCGNSYQATGVKEIQAVAQETTTATLGFMEKCSADDDWFLPDGRHCCTSANASHRLVGMTQEHGKIEPTSGKLDFDKFPLGSLISLIPYHVSALVWQCANSCYSKKVLLPTQEGDCTLDLLIGYS